MNYKDINHLATLIAKKEGIKSETHIGDIREIIRVLSELILEDPKLVLLLMRYALTQYKK